MDGDAVRRACSDADAACLALPQRAPRTTFVCRHLLPALYVLMLLFVFPTMLVALPSLAANDMTYATCFVAQAIAFGCLGLMSMPVVCWGWSRGLSFGSPSRSVPRRTVDDAELRALMAPPPDEEAAAGDPAERDEPAALCDALRKCGWAWCAFLVECGAGMFTCGLSARFFDAGGIRARRRLLPFLLVISALSFGCTAALSHVAAAAQLRNDCDPDPRRACSEIFAVRLLAVAIYHAAAFAETMLVVRERDPAPAPAPPVVTTSA
jgi:hypothetical protein